MASRKKKKKQKQLQQKALEKQGLNGWNCPALESDDETESDVETFDAESGDSAGLDGKDGVDAQHESDVSAGSAYVQLSITEQITAKEAAYIQISTGEGAQENEPKRHPADDRHRHAAKEKAAGLESGYEQVSIEQLAATHGERQSTAPERIERRNSADFSPEFAFVYENQASTNKPAQPQTARTEQPAQPQTARTEQPAQPQTARTEQPAEPQVEKTEQPKDLSDKEPFGERVKNLSQKVAEFFKARQKASEEQDNEPAEPLVDETFAEVHGKLEGVSFAAQEQPRERSEQRNIPQQPRVSAAPAISRETPKGADPVSQPENRLPKLHPVTAVAVNQERQDRAERVARDAATQTAQQQMSVELQGTKEQSRIDIVGAYIKNLGQSVIGFFSAPRKSPEELAEDEVKFGGLDDEPKPTVAAVAKPVQKPLPVGVKAIKPEQTHSDDEGTVVYQTRYGKRLLAQLSEWAKDVSGWAFDECYYIGVLLMRYCSDIRRMCFRSWVWIKYTVPPLLSEKRKQLGRAFDHFVDSCMEPFNDIKNKTRAMKYRLATRNEETEDKRESAVSIFAQYLYSLGRPLNKVVSFVLPIFGGAVLMLTVLYFQQLNYALEVHYGGAVLGYVERENDFYQAQNMVYDRLLGAEYIDAQQNHPTFRLVIADGNRLTDVETLANSLMAMSGHDVVTADGVFIDGAFLGAVESGSEFLLYIDKILDNYRTGTANERVQFVKKVTVQQGLYPQGSLRPIHEIQNALESNETVPQLHTVAAQETLETIAADNNTTVDAILELNSKLRGRVNDDETNTPSLIEGEEILVNTVELSLGIQVTRREVYTEDIAYGTDYVDVATMPESYYETISLGIKGERQITADVTYIDGERVSETVLQREVLSEPVNARQKRGTMKPAQFVTSVTDGRSTSFMWPVAGGRLTYGLYGYAGHTGMDIAAPAGTGIYASADGTVTAAYAYSYGLYGKRVDINHGNGTMTRYAHCSEVLVVPGQYVRQGQLIAKVGRTGNAFGNHCHFEIRINGVVMNPASFIGNAFPGYG